MKLKESMDLEMLDELAANHAEYEAWLDSIEHTLENDYAE